jgi:Fur family ferric uptake transcriptional regulator
MAARSAKYTTQQGRRILEYLAALGDKHSTVEQIVQHFKKQKPAIGQTTVYRHLEKLNNSGVLRRFVLDEGSACYQFVESAACQEHFHLKCEKCGGLIHLECTLLDEIQTHVLKEHSFQINALKTIFYGTCKRCLQ